MHSTPRRLRALLPLLALALLGSALPGPAAHAAPASVALDGEVAHPATLSVEDLRQRPAVTQTVSYDTSHGRQTRSYIGASLWDLLDRAGLAAGSQAKNAPLGKYVLATGADGYRAVFSVGELNPELGNRASLVAYAQAGKSDAGGGLHLTAPGDRKGGRYVSMLARIDVRASGSTQQGTGGGISSGFTLSGQVQKPARLDLAALRALPAVTVQAGNSRYTGVDLWYLVDTVGGLKTSPQARNPTLAMYLVATGSDGYQAVVSLGELDPAFGAAHAVVAYEANGRALDRNGVARLVMADDRHGSRGVSNLTALEVFAAP